MKEGDTVRVKSGPCKGATGYIQYVTDNKLWPYEVRFDQRWMDENRVKDTMCPYSESELEAI